MRTNLDWSKHQHRVEIFKSDENEIRVDHLQIDRNRGLYVKFINTDDTLSVTGDFGNYIFCRPFVPSSEGYVSDHYWAEKLTYNSIQNFEQNDYDFDEIIKELEELLETVEEDYSEVEDQEAVKDYIDSLIESASQNDKLEYEYRAYRELKPDFIDYDFAPAYKKKRVSLQIVFDAFEEICRRIKEENK